MSDADPTHLVRTRIWREEAEADNPFATRAAYCRGYDVFGAMVGNARWVEMLFLLFRDQLPAIAELDMFEALAVALANPGPRDPSVHAAMCGGVGGSTAAASLMAALSVGAGRLGGARDVFDAMCIWNECGTDATAWPVHAARMSKRTEIWPPGTHPPGSDPYGVAASTVVKQLLATLSCIGGTRRIEWLAHHREEFENALGHPLSISGVAAAAFSDLGFSAAEGEMLFLLLRLPGAAAHAMEQGGYGYKQFPFFPVELEDDPVRKDKE
ncbi:citryl-CoA lyase [Herbaspirillum sp. HC18]|nr:citryl-CoA lyase [Herbaspirillum sp. HC18]